MTETKIAEKTEKLETKAQAAATTEAEEKPKLFNLAQIAGGALAAVTTAAVGSRLGVAGTLVGAALASVLAAFASTLYTKGLERTRDGVKKIVLRDADGKTEVITVPDEGERESSLQQTGVPVKGRDKKSSGWGRPLAVLGGVVATAAVTFVVAMGVVTGWEFGTGQTLDGRTGTTIGQVSNRRASTKPTPTVNATPTATPSATATPTESGTPTATPTPSASATPTATPTPSATAEASQGAADSGHADFQG